MYNFDLQVYLLSEPGVALSNARYLKNLRRDLERTTGITFWNFDYVRRGKLGRIRSVDIDAESNFISVFDDATIDMRRSANARLAGFIDQV